MWKPRVPDRLPTGTIGTGDIANVVIIPNDYVLVDLTGFVKFSPQLTLNLGVFNLFDTLYFDYSDLRFSGLNRNNPADVARVGRFAQPGRSFAASLNWRF
ncbi:MAG: hypothetical protein ACK4QL_11745 [Pseudanabaenaceae cyanobacterium]